MRLTFKLGDTYYPDAVYNNENNDNLLKQCIDLDALGLSSVQTVEEFEKIFGSYKPYQG